MTTCTLDQLLSLFDDADDVEALRQLAGKPGVDGILVYVEHGGRTAVVYGSRTKYPLLEDALAAYGRRFTAHYCTAMPAPATLADMPKSKTMQAVALVEAGMSAYAAAKKLGINPSAVSRALSRREDKTICPCCGQVVREGFKVDRAVVKAPSR